MDYICTNCGNEFEDDNIKPRCPVCLRQHGILENEIVKNKDNRQNKYRKYIVLGSVIVVVIFISLILLYTMSHRISRSNSKKNENLLYVFPVNTNIIIRIKENIGVSFKKSDFPFEISSTLIKKAKKLGTVEKIGEFIKKSSHGEVNSRSPKNISAPSQLLNSLSERKYLFTSFEWAFLHFSLLKTIKIPCAMIEIVKAGGDFVNAPVLSGRYGVAIFKDSNYKEDPLLLIDSVKDYGNISDYNLLSSDMIASRFSSLKAYSLIHSNPFSYSFIISPKKEPRSHEEITTITSWVRAAISLDSKSSLAYSVSSWVYQNIGLTKQAEKKADIASSLLEAPEMKGYYALIKAMNGNMLDAKKMLKNSPPRYKLLKIIVNYFTEGVSSLSAHLDYLVKSKLESAKYLELLYNIDSSSEKAGSLFSKYEKLYPHSSWVFLLKFSFLIKEKRYDDAEKIIPKVASFGKNPSEISKKLKTSLAKIKENNKQKQMVK